MSCFKESTLARQEGKDTRARLVGIILPTCVGFPLLTLHFLIISTNAHLHLLNGRHFKLNK